MTEVPDHLLQRSRERRAALGGESAPPAAPSAAGGGEAAEPGGEVAVPAAAAAPAVIEPAAPPPPPPPYVQAALERKKVPAWMAGAGVGTLLWAFVYAGVLFSPGESITDPEVAHGQEVYASQCAGCHGGSGQGGTGRKLSNEVLLTFPDPAEHIEWVTNGSPAAGTPYGDPDRPGGQHVSQDGFGAMPGFGDALSEEDIRAVVRYEREVLDDEEPSGSAEAGGANDPSAEAGTEGGEADQSSSSEDEDAGSGSGETEGGGEDDADLDQDEGGPEADTDAESDE